MDKHHMKERKQRSETNGHFLWWWESSSRAPPPACSEVFCEGARIKVAEITVSMRRGWGTRPWSEVTEQENSRWAFLWINALWYTQGSWLAPTPPEQRCGALINAATKTSMHSLAVVQKACKMLGMAKKGTGNKSLKKKKKQPHYYGAAWNSSTTF